MREAIAHRRNANFAKAGAAMEGALALRPNDAYYREIEGQIFLDNRRFGAAVASYARAAQRAPHGPPILGGYV